VDFNHQSFVGSCLTLRKLKFDQFYTSRNPVCCLCATTSKAHTTELFEAPALSLNNALKIAVFAYQNRIGVLRCFCNDGVRRIWRNKVATASNYMSARLKKLTDRFRHTLVGEKPQLSRGGQAATLWLERTN